ncbi:Cof-type HAD-IIB family hydrolase [Paenibacillus alkaliterrae]|uniref:Cof-type HAD-IIB family hydrolase n=1 Tax=Paenibacillus alkaliterrae TaxID=320909 RepID=UPI001F467338|nr:Cof-type HAD-IIB family hydrolase [Paenibacillus alkaliterrae]MCF2941792.1 Cof-type HAD-IIB family hydrolase [Paenibacillus alkaliterrae]
MKNKRKLIFFDIDGTLLDRNKKLPSSAKASIAELKNNGHEVAIATGRSPFMFQDLRLELGIDTFVALNGQYVVYKEKIIYRNPLRTNLLESLTGFATDQGHPVVFMDIKGMKMNVPNHSWIEVSLGPLQQALPEHDPNFYLTHDIYQAMVFCSEDHEESYRKRFNHMRFVRWHEVSMDVMPANGSKANGIVEIMKRANMEKDDVYAFGDHYNDIEMLRFVGHGISMGNAVETVQKEARYVTKNVEEDGILFGLKMVGLL